MHVRKFQGETIEETLKEIKVELASGRDNIKNDHKQRD